MKKILFVVLFLVLLVDGVWGATYYSNTVSGVNTNLGSEAAPWKDMQFGIEKLTSGDTLVATAPATAPSRGLFQVHYPPSSADVNKIIIQGSSTDNKAYVLGSIDVSDGGSIGNLLPNPGMEDWISNTNVYGWVETLGDGIVIQDTSIKDTGLSSLKIQRVTDYPYIEVYINLPASTAMTFSVRYRNNLAGKPLHFLMWDKVANEKLDSSGVWGPTDITLPDSVGAFSTYTISFNTNSSGRYAIRFTGYWSSQPSWIDNVSLTYDLGVNWSVHSGDTYKLEKTIQNCQTLLKTTSVLWAASGASTLRYILKATSLADCITNAGTWWFESDTVYYHLAAGETIDSVHIEAAQKGHKGSSDAVGAIQVDVDNITLNNIEIKSSFQTGFYLNGTGLELNHNISENTPSHGYFVNSGTATINDSESNWTADNDGFCFGGGTTTINRCSAYKNWDEGIEAYNGAIATVNTSLSHNNGLNGDSGSEGIYSGDADTVLTVNNCTSWGNKGAGVGVGSLATLVIKNTLLYNNEYYDVRASSGAILTADHNYYNTSYDQWDALGGAGTGTIIGAIPRLLTNGKLRDNSPVRRSKNLGVAIAGVNGTGTTDYWGNAGLDDSIPIGAYFGSGINIGILGIGYSKMFYMGN